MTSSVKALTVKTFRLILVRAIRLALDGTLPAGPGFAQFFEAQEGIDKPLFEDGRASYMLKRKAEGCHDDPGTCERIPYRAASQPILR